ncbi:MAG: hypothetical protein WA294_22510 [Acidobacteriaceae bacterium]
MGSLVLGALLTLAPAAFAQHAAGGHAGGFGGGHVGGFSGSHGGSFGGGFSGHSFGGFSGARGFGSYRAPRSFTTAPRMNYTLPSRGLASAYGRMGGRLSAGRGGEWRERGRDGDRGRYRGYGYGGYPYGAGYAWELTPWELGYPDFLGYGNDVGFSGDSGQPAAGSQQDTADASSDSSDGYRQDYGAAPGYNAALSDNPEPFGAPATTLASEPQLTLIFNDGRREAIRNYALTGDSVIVLDNADTGRQQRIPLSDLNLPATEQAAQQAGLDFSPPA